MKRITKTPEPDVLTKFTRSYPDANWQKVRDHNKGRDYQVIKKYLAVDQYYLCAYCEKKLTDNQLHLQRVEHFHPKSDATTSHNWALDWNNMLLVCMGGSDNIETDHSKYPLPINLSCDAYKEHYINTHKLSANCEEYLLNPLTIPATKLFEFDKATGKLIASPVITDTEITQRIEKSIEILNLNCVRLREERLLVLNHYNKTIRQARNNGNRKIFTQLTERWLSKPYLSFFTTRRALLSKHAEKFLAS